MNKHLLFLALLAPALQATAQQLPMRLWYDRPAQYFEEAMPIGNGRLGAMVYGGAGRDTLYINDITFWTGKPVDLSTDSTATGGFRP